MSRIKNKIFVIFLYLLLIGIVTYPLFLNLNTYIPGFFSTEEPYGSLWNSWRIQYSFINGFPFLTRTPLIAYPFGVNLYASGYVTYLLTGFIYLFSLFLSPVLVYNLQMISNFFFVAIISYLLTFYLTKNKFSAFFAGMVMAVCPYQFVRSWQHPGLTYNQLLPLVLLSAILLKEKNSKKIRIFFFLSLFLLLSFDYSVTYLGGIILICFFSYVLFYNWKLKLFKQRKLIFKDIDYFKRVFLISICVSIILLPQLFLVIKRKLNSSYNIVPSGFNYDQRPFEDLFTQSARPLSYFLPAFVHPVFGKFTGRFLGSPLYGISVTEHTIYLGWIPLILAFFAFKKWKKLRLNKAGIEREREHFYVGFFIFLAVLAWLFSQPPWWSIGHFRIYMPSFLMYKIFPVFRSYCRFGIVVMLSVAILSGYGLKFILEKFKTKKTKIIITCLFCGIVLFEFCNWPPYKVIDVSKAPLVYCWLEEKKGDFAIAEYPLDEEGPMEIYKFYQIFHHKSIINGTIPGTHANEVAKTITMLSKAETASILKWMEVKYVLVHKDRYTQTELVERVEELENISKNKGLKLVKSFPPQECPSDIMCVQKIGPIDVYEVVEEKEEPEVL